eukprot:jgi/Tetstr1/464552/TSEL_009309.t1
MLLADKVNLVTDEDTGLPHIFSFPSEKFVAPPAEFEIRYPKLRDCNMVAQSYMDQVGTYEGRQALRLAEDLSYEPEIDMVVNYLTYMDARHGNIDGSHRRDAKRMGKFNYPETYWDNKGICYTSDKMYTGLSPEVCRYMSMKLNEADQTVVGDTSMHKLLVMRRMGESPPVDNEAGDGGGAAPARGPAPPPTEKGSSPSPAEASADLEQDPKDDNQVKKGEAHAAAET